MATEKVGKIVEFVPWHKSFKDEGWIIKGKIIAEHKTEDAVFYKINRLDKRKTFECSFPKGEKRVCPKYIYRSKSGHKFRKVKK